MSTILKLYRIERPLLFFGVLALLFALIALVLAAPLAVTYYQTHLVPRFPTAILVTGLVIVAALSLFAGLILDTVVHARREIRRLAYLALPAPGRPDGGVRRGGVAASRGSVGRTTGTPHS